MADQEGPPIEHIIQDGGTDGIREMLSSEFSHLMKEDGKLQLFVENDSGMYDAVNRGLLKGRGDICAYLNCDEQYLPGALAHVATFFENHPAIDVVFGNVVVVNKTGDYICSREVLAPRKWHTWVCTLGVFTAATFFRRRLIEEDELFFLNDWRVIGDAVWILELLKHKVRMARLGLFTTAFTDTGENLALGSQAEQEQRRLRQSAPFWMQSLAPLWSAQHRLRKLLHGLYFPKKLTYSIFTPDSPSARRTFPVDDPQFIWPGRSRKG